MRLAIFGHVRGLSEIIPAQWSHIFPAETGRWHTSRPGAVLEKNIWGSKTKKLTTFFSRRPQNTGQNYQINHSNLQKTPPYDCLLVLLQHTATVTKDWGQGSGLPPPCPNVKPPLVQATHRTGHSEGDLVDGYVRHTWVRTTTRSWHWTHLCQSVEHRQGPYVMLGALEGSEFIVVQAVQWVSEWACYGWRIKKFFEELSADPLKCKWNYRPTGMPRRVVGMA